MKVGFATQFRNVLGRPWRQFWEDGLWLMHEAEAMGFDGLWVQEHFFEEHGYAPSVSSFLTLLAERTSRVRIGTYVAILPLHHAGYFAQQMAVIDHLSEGRLDVQVGMGARAMEYRAFGYDPRSRKSRMEESLDVLRLAWTQRPFSYHGRHYDLDDLIVLPEPFQQPHPPLWVAGSAPVSAARAGTLGANLAAVSNDPAVYDAYLGALDAAGHDRGAISISQGISVTATREDPDVVWERNRRHYAKRWDYYAGHGMDIGREAESLDFGLERSDDFYRQFELIADPDTVIETLKAITGRLPLTHLNLAGFADGIPVEECYDQLKLFAETVLPVIHDW